MARFLYYFITVFLSLLLDFINGAVVQVSNPFDPYRLECPHKFAVIKLTLQRVESTGHARNDTLIASFCENIAKLYPSDRDDISPADDEDCRWTAPIEIPGSNFGFNEICSQREFIAGISRQEMLQYGFLCCKLKDRKRKKCFANRYTLPSADVPEIAVERNQLLLSSLAFQDEHLIAQFCDYAVMNQDEIDQEIITESKTKLAAWFAAAQIANPRPTIIQGRQFVNAPTQSPINNGQSTLFPGDDDSDNNGDNNHLPRLIPRDKNEFVATTTTTRPTTRFTVPSLFGLKVLKPKTPIRYSLSPEELAAFAVTRATTDLVIDDNELGDDVKTATTQMSMLRQRASLAAFLKRNTTRTREPRTLFFTKSSTTTTTTATPTTVELDNGQFGLDTPTPIPAVDQQRVSLANFLNRILTTSRPTTTTTRATTTTTAELDDSNNEEDFETTAPAVVQQRVALANFLNKSVTTPPPPKPTTVTTTIITTEELDDDSEQNAITSTPFPALLLQRASLGKLLNKFVTTKLTTLTTRKSTTPTTTTEEVATEEYDLETDVNPVGQQRASVASLLHKGPTTKPPVKTITTAIAVTTSAIEGVDNEFEESEPATTSDPLANRISALEKFLKIDSSTKLPLKDGRSKKVNDKDVTTLSPKKNPPKTTKRPKSTTQSETDIALEIGSPAEPNGETGEGEQDESLTTSASGPTKKQLKTRTTKSSSKKPSTSISGNKQETDEQETAQVEFTETPADEDTTETTGATTKTPTIIKVKTGRQRSNFLTRESKKIKLPTIGSPSDTTTTATTTTTTTESSPDVIEISIEDFVSRFPTSTTVKGKRLKPQRVTTPTFAAGTAEQSIETVTESARTKQKNEDLPDVPAVIVVPTDYDLSPDAIPLQNKLLVKAVSSARTRTEEKGQTQPSGEDDLGEIFALTPVGSTTENSLSLTEDGGLLPVVEDLSTSNENSSFAVGQEISTPVPNELTVASDVIEITRPTPKHKKSRGGTRKPGKNSGVKPSSKDGQNGTLPNKPDEYYYYYFYDGTDNEESSTPVGPLTTRELSTGNSTSISNVETSTLFELTTNGLSSQRPTVVKNDAKIICNTTLAATEETSGLVIACGVGSNIWVPPRCPLHTFCMESSDTNFRICCPALFVVRV